MRIDFLDGLLKKKGNKEASQEEEVNEKNDESNG